MNCPPHRRSHLLVRAVLAARLLGCVLSVWLTAVSLPASEPGQIVAQQKVREGFIAVTGGKVWFRIIGADKPGIPLLTLHGGPGVPSDALELLAPLTDERPLVVYDQLGSGRSDVPEGNSLYRVERYVEELAQVRAALGLKRVHLMGHSWGTMLGLEYMLTKPAGVESLIFAGPCLSVKRWVDDQKSYLAQMPQSVRDAVAKNEAAGTTTSPEYLAAVGAYYRQHLLRMDEWPPIMKRDRFGDAVYQYMWGPSEFTCTGTLGTYERADRLAEIRVPTLYTCGEFDEATPAATAFYQGQTPGAKIKVFAGASHMTYVEQPEAYCAAVREFLHGVEKH
ncbi:MAG: alpha/beta fold hydrolase [Lacunisphaera sp.]|nr:alpha/beta fold hydrolase [Lacunisphaera sp.]